MGELTLRQLEYFVAVVDAGSVTSASKKVNVTQATVSMAIAQLESHLGTDLLIRQQSRGVVPTRAGRELSARARHVVAMTTEIEQVAATGTSEISGVLEIGCVSSLSPQVVPPISRTLRKTLPASDLQLPRRLFWRPPAGTHRRRSRYGLRILPADSRSGPLPRHHRSHLEDHASS